MLSSARKNKINVKTNVLGEEDLDGVLSTVIAIVYLFCTHNTTLLTATATSRF